MELKINFDGRNLAVLALAMVCVLGIYSGASLAIAANDSKVKIEAMKVKIEKIRSGKSDQLSMQETLEVAALGMQLKLEPNFLENLEIEEGKNLLRGYAILACSLLGAGALFVYYRRRSTSRKPTGNA